MQSLSLSVGYMWACLHDQRNAKSSPDHYNMPSVHNLHEIHIHSSHAGTWSLFLHSYCALVSLRMRFVLFCVIYVSYMLQSSFLYSFYPQNFGLHLYKLAAYRNCTKAVHLKKKKKGGSTSFAAERECKREGNVSLAPML